MARNSITFAADASLTKIMTIGRNRNLKTWFGTVAVYGTFGSGTITMFMSPDGGTTKVAVTKDNNSVAIGTLNAAAVFNLEFGNGDSNTDKIILYATLAGATNPALTVAVFDNQ